MLKLQGKKRKKKKKKKKAVKLKTLLEPYDFHLIMALNASIQKHRLGTWNLRIGNESLYFETQSEI